MSVCRAIPTPVRRCIATVLCALFVLFLPLPLAAQEAPAPGEGNPESAVASSQMGSSLTSGLVDRSGGRPIVIADSQARPGEIVRVVVPAGSELERVELRDGERVLATGARITARMTDLVGLGVFLLGVNSTVAPGDYELHGVSPDELEQFVRPFEVVPYAFRREEIPLNATLTSLRSDYDPRKVEETRILSELVLSRDPEALYHSGPLGWPLPPDTRRTSYFGDRRTYLYSDGERAQAIHHGVDFASPTGTPILSAGDGMVRMARDRIVTGKTVVIEHLPGVYSLYYHLDELNVDEGVFVEQGARLGTVGATGLATGPHLHWELRVGGVPVSPDWALERPLLSGVP